MYYVNENVKKCTRIFPAQGRGDFLRLDMNENPEGLPEAVAEKIKEEITPEFLAMYPEPDVFEKKYADFLNVPQGFICTTNGSDSAIRYVMQAFVKPGNEVVTVSPTFEMYMVNCWLLGLVHKPVSYQPDLTIRIEDILEAITSDTDMVVLLNPNNPIGNIYGEAEAVRIIEKARENQAVVVIDEAYHYFCDKTFLGLIKRYDNVMLLRTFSKCFSLAGVRLGAVIGNEELIHYVRNLRLSFEVNTLALKCGEVVLDTPGLLEELKKTERDGRTWIINALRNAGYDCFSGEGNFVFFKSKLPPEVLKAQLADKKVLVKTYSSPLLKEWVRINTGSEVIMRRFMKLLHEVEG